ncbi:MAG: FhaA domain-containing protein [Anaerolineales bacterium]
MTNSLSRFEARLQRLIEEGTAKLFSSRDLKGQLASRLIEAMHIDVQFGEGEALVAPGIYTIHVNGDHVTALQANQTLLEDLKIALLNAALESGITLCTEPVLHILPQNDLPLGQFTVRSDGVDVSLTQTQGLRAVLAPDQRQVPPGAFLIVGGAEIFSLTLPVVNVGRKKDNHLVIDNPAVSRRHAQLRAIAGHYHFFDLGSSSGSKINNADVKNAILLAGDVINLAGVPLIYGHEAAPSSSETQEYRPGAVAASHQA